MDVTSDPVEDARLGGGFVNSEPEYAVVDGVATHDIPAWLCPNGNRKNVDSKADLDYLIMNYLLMEGHKEAAETFCKESGTQMNVPTSHIEERIQVRDAVCSGRVAEAIALVNELESSIFDSNKAVYVNMLKQQLVEIIRDGDIARAVEFARTELADAGKENHRHLAELEETLALILHDDPEKSPYSHLLSRSRLQCLSSEMNAAIMKQFDLPVTSGLRRHLQIIRWTQEILSKQSVTHYSMSPVGSMQFSSVGKTRL